MFNSVELDTTKARLENLQYFSDVQATGSPGGSGYRDVDVLVEEKATGSVGVGVGFSSIDSLVGFMTLEQANFDLFNPWNFTGGGQRFGMNLRVGTQRSEFSVSLVEPWFLDQQLALGGELFFRESAFFSDNFDQSNMGAAISLRKPLGAKDSIRGEMRFEQVSIDSEVDGDDYPGAVGPNGETQSQFDEELIGGDFIRSALAINYIYDSRDSVILPRVGHRIDLGLTYAGLGGDVETLTLSAQGAKFWNLKWDTILSVNGELAFVDSLADEVPIFERLFLGGARTLRGFEFRDVGPRDKNFTEDVFGGNSLGYLTVEYTVPVIETVRAAVFYDTGFVNEDSWDPSPGDLYSNYGVGIRLKLPISPLPLALDYAIPLASPDEEADKGGQFQFSLSSQF
jgi:outer membrane protein insertion porin family